MNGRVSDATIWQVAPSSDARFWLNLSCLALPLLTKSKQASQHIHLSSFMLHFPWPTTYYSATCSVHCGRFFTILVLPLLLLLFCNIFPAHKSKWNIFACQSIPRREMFLSIRVNESLGRSVIFGWLIIGMPFIQGS